MGCHREPARAHALTGPRHDDKSAQSLQNDRTGTWGRRTSEGLREALDVQVGQEVEDVLHERHDVTVHWHLPRRHRLEVLVHLPQPPLQPLERLHA